jgi:hypothetical protein
MGKGNFFLWLLNLSCLYCHFNTIFCWYMQVPGILFTPICPHSLSFRPLILPEYVTLRVQVPFNSRGQAWASFDGKDRIQLGPGDALICSVSPWPLPTACLMNSTTDFLRSIHEGLHWNLRKSQSFEGPYVWSLQLTSCEVSMRICHCNLRDNGCFDVPSARLF